MNDLEVFFQSAFHCERFATKITLVSVLVQSHMGFQGFSARIHFMTNVTLNFNRTMRLGVTLHSPVGEEGFLAMRTLMRPVEHVKFLNVHPQLSAVNKSPVAGLTRVFGRYYTVLGGQMFNLRFV